MLLQEQIDKILNGEIGLTVQGYRVKYVGKSDDDAYPNYFIVMLGKDDTIIGSATLDSCLKGFYNFGETVSVIGLVNEERHFNLERALQGEPVQLRNQDKAYIVRKLERPETPNATLIGYSEYVYENQLLQGSMTWDLRGRAEISGASPYDIIGMWED